MNFDKLIRSRKSIRSFKKTSPDWRDIIECIDAARFIPTAGNNYTLKFIMIDDMEKINQIAKYCQQDFITQAHYIVVACSNPSRTINAYGEAGKIYSRQQAGAGMQNFWLKLVEKNLSTCWVGLFVESEVKELLKIPKEVNVEAIFPIGYSNEKSEKKAKIELDSILYFNKYGEKKMKKEKVLSA
ncbi:nitroreductase family protein [Candidatus Pacearchaeota archaeon]|nr:nitroreductase family protein [Candidatus Pacearchaeota archaeon]